MKTLIVTLVAVASLVLAGMAFADQGGTPSCNGAAHGAFANVNGNFGWLGDAGVYARLPRRRSRAGARATGYNNSTASATCNAAG